MTCSIGPPSTANVGRPAAPGAGDHVTRVSSKAAHRASHAPFVVRVFIAALAGYLDALPERPKQKSGPSRSGNGSVLVDLLVGSTRRARTVDRRDEGALAGGARISFEGDLRHCVFPPELPRSSAETFVLRRNTIAPVQDFVVLPLEPETIAPILAVG